MIDLLTGDDYVKTKRLTLEESLERIKQDSLAFKAKKERYHLYEI